VGGEAGPQPLAANLDQQEGGDSEDGAGD